MSLSMSVCMVTWMYLILCMYVVFYLLRFSRYVGFIHERSCHNLAIKLENK